MIVCNIFKCPIFTTSFILPVIQWGRFFPYLSKEEETAFIEFIELAQCPQITKVNVSEIAVNLLYTRLCVPTKSEVERLACMEVRGKWEWDAGYVGH